MDESPPSPVGCAGQPFCSVELTPLCCLEQTLRQTLFYPKRRSSAILKGRNCSCQRENTGVDQFWVAASSPGDEAATPYAATNNVTRNQTYLNHAKIRFFSPGRHFAGPGHHARRPGFTHLPCLPSTHWQWRRSPPAITAPGDGPNRWSISRRSPANCRSRQACRGRTSCTPRASCGDDP